MFGWMLVRGGSGLSVWLDARREVRWSREQIKAATAVIDGSSIRDRELYRDSECIGRVVESRSEILDAVRAGVYEIVFIDAPFDKAIASFALDRSDHCRSISGIDVAIAVRVDSPRDLDQARELNRHLIAVLA